MHSRSIAISALALLTVLGLTACAPPSAADPQPAPTTGDGHGAIAGAQELPEPQLGLTTVSADGAVSHLDLLDGSVAEIGAIDAPRALTTDGRYLFADTADGVSVVDSGVWTWDHVDHFHYYRAEAAVLGTVAGEGPATIATTNSSTTGGTGVFFSGSGDAVLLDTEALSKGELVERFRIEVAPHDGMVVPVGSFALITNAAAGGSASALVAHTSDGEELPDLAADCPAARGTITTRVGAVVGCADGAVLATVESDGLRLEKILYPAGSTAPPATAFSNREGRPTVAGLAGDQGIWMLDTRERNWTLLPAPAPLLQVSAVDDADQHLLALTTDGRVLVLDGASGAELAATAPLLPETLTDPAALAGVSLIAGQQRAYLNAPLEQTLYEIDFADAARIARSFPADGQPLLVAETGR